MTERTAQYPDQIYNVSVVYNIYRILLPLVLLVTSLTPGGSMLGELNPTLFVRVCSSYAILALAVTLFARTGNRFFSSSKFFTGSLIIDIFAITFISYSSGGMISGLGLLLIITIASGSILIRGRITTFLAAVATLTLIYSELYLTLSLENPPGQFIQTGILGALLFATSLYVQNFTGKIYDAALLADKQAGDIIDLEKLNNEIIQRMRTGVVVVNAEFDIVSMNRSARDMLLPILPSSKHSAVLWYTLPDTIKEQLQLWKINPKRHAQAISIPDSSKQILLSFALLNPESDSDTLIFLEDNQRIIQRVRQMKLASLGQLTASIAHEIRNPLGAISHAGQLLSESDNPTDDKRMIEIILEQCGRVNQIIEDVLNASRHDDTTAKIITLEDWLKTFIKNYQSTHELCEGIEFEPSLKDIKVNVIEGQLEQVLNNLFDNGLRYSHKQTGHATLVVQSGVENSNGEEHAYLHIIDDGAGVDEEAEPQMFEPFHTTESSGTGLGLYISRELCEANQSQLIYNRTKTGKSCFSIYFGNPDRMMA